MHGRAKLDAIAIDSRFDLLALSADGDILHHYDVENVENWFAEDIAGVLPRLFSSRHE